MSPAIRHAGQLVREMVQTRLDRLKVAQGRPGAPLAYRQVSGASAIPLLVEPSAAEWTLWTCPTSMREVEPNVNFVMVTRDPSIDNAPPFDRAVSPDGQGTLTARRRGRRRSDGGRARMKPVKSPRVGAVRPSQLMFSHGVGSLVDLPNFSAVVAGLDDWDTTYQQTLVERRLLAAVRQMPEHGAGRGAANRAVARGDAQPVRRLGARRRAGRAVPTLDALHRLQPARSRSTAACSI